jgi:hypothetical protein
MAEQDNNKRGFSVTLSSGKEIELTVRAATNEEMQEAEFEYSKAFNYAVMHGIMTSSKLLSELAANGVWTEEDDQKVEDQRQEVIRLEDAIENAEDDDAKQRIADDLKEARQELYQLRQGRSAILSHSAEAKADEAQRNFLTACVTEFKDSGKRVWKNYQAYKKEEDSSLLFKVTYEYLTFVNGLPSDFIDQLPENQVAKDEEEDADDGERPAPAEASPTEETQPEEAAPETTEAEAAADAQ